MESILNKNEFPCWLSIQWITNCVVGLSSLPAPIAGQQEMLCRALTVLKTVYHFRQQLLVHRDLCYPFPPIKARKEGLHLDQLSLVVTL